MSEQPSRRGPYAKSAERRTALARAAVELIQQDGHAGLTTGEVARRAGTSERTLFYHFPSRDHLLVAALELMDADTQDDMHLRFADTDPLDVELIDFDQVVTELSARDAGHPWKVRLTAHLSGLAQDSEHPAHAYFAQHYAFTIQQFAILTRAMQARGQAHPDLDPERVARRLVALWDGLQVQWLTTPDFDLAGEIQQAFRQLTGQAVMEVRAAIDEVMGLQTAALRPA